MGDILQIAEIAPTLNIADKLRQIERRQSLADEQIRQEFPAAFTDSYCHTFFNCDDTGKIVLTVSDDGAQVPVYLTCQKFKRTNCHWLKAQRLTDWQRAADLLNSTHKMNKDHLLPEDAWKDTSYLRCAKDYLHKHHPNNLGLIMLGDMRVGKTAATGWLAINLIMQHGYTRTNDAGKTVYPVLWIRSGVLAMLLTGSFEKRDRIRELIDGAKVLIVDDLGTELGQIKSQLENYLSQFFFIVDEFYGEGKYFIATSNLSFKESGSPDFDEKGKEIAYLDNIYNARTIARLKEKCIIFADDKAPRMV